MSDLVAELRQVTGTARESSPYRVADTCRRAADEIERLTENANQHQADVERLTAVSEERAQTARALHEHLGRTLQERDRLRAALERIEKLSHHGEYRTRLGASRLGDIAREALTGTSPVDSKTGVELNRRDEWKAAAQEACDENNALRAERDRLLEHGNLRQMREIDRLRAALGQYGDHRVSCPISGVFPPHEGVGYVCTCGYEKALAGGEK